MLNYWIVVGCEESHQMLRQYLKLLNIILNVLPRNQLPKFFPFLMIMVGPDFCWHADRYGKLKPYGLLIHGCVDGVKFYGLKSQEPTVIQ